MQKQNIPARNEVPIEETWNLSLFLNRLTPGKKQLIPSSYLFPVFQFSRVLWLNPRSL